MKISVIIPSYQPRDYIYKCLDSISNQTLFSGRFEVIIILNGEKEPYFSAIHEYIENFKNIRCVYNPIKGVSSARNLGLDLSTNSEYIVFIDDDDYISNNYLEVLLNTIMNSNASIVQSNLKCDNNNKITEDYISDAFERLNNKNYNAFYFRNLLSTVWGKIYKKEIIDKIRFRENFKIAEDALFIFEVSKNIKNIILTNENCIYYRNIREGSAIRSYRSPKTIFIDFFNKIVAFTSIYIKSPLKYSFIFYFSRLLAVAKVLFIELRIIKS